MGHKKSISTFQTARFSLFLTAVMNCKRNTETSFVVCEEEIIYVMGGGGLFLPPPGKS